MAKSIFDSLLTGIAKSADRAIKEAKKEQEKKAKAQRKYEAARLRASTHQPKEVQVRKAYGTTPAARTEIEADSINRSYRAADHNRWRGQDFVVGIEIRRSNNPTAGCEMCEIGSGKYPKSFKFTGWCAGCKCQAIPILKTPEEMEADTNRILAGRAVSEVSINSVVTLPYKLISYIRRHPELQSAPWYLENKPLFDKQI